MYYSFSQSLSLISGIVSIAVPSSSLTCSFSSNLLLILSNVFSSMEV